MLRSITFSFQLFVKISQNHNLTMRGGRLVKILFLPLRNKVAYIQVAMILEGNSVSAFLKTTRPGVQQCQAQGLVFCP